MNLHDDDYDADTDEFEDDEPTLAEIISDIDRRLGELSGAIGVVSLVVIMLVFNQVQQSYGIGWAFGASLLLAVIINRA